MKIVKVLCVLVLLLLSNVSFSQKVKIKKNIVYVNGKKYVKTSDRGINTDSYSLYTIDDEKEIIFILDVPPQTEGKIRYPYYHYLVKFIGTDKEVRFGQNRIKVLIKELYKSKVITDEGIDKSKMIVFIEKYS